MTKILFIYYMEPEIERYWNDGLKVALELLDHNQDIKLTYTNIYSNQLTDFNEYDFVLGWGGFNSPVDQKILSLKKTAHGKLPKIGLCIGGNAFPVRHDDTYDVLFYETTWFAPQVKWHKNARRAFGINSEVFYELNTSDISDLLLRDCCDLYDWISVGSLSNWKRHHLLINKPGNRLCIGQIQKNNLSESMSIAKELLTNDIAVSGMVEAYQLALIYNITDNVYMPASILGGGERVVWEARACGCNVEIEPDNPKLQSLLDEPVLDEYSYYKALLYGIKSCLK